MTDFECKMNRMKEVTFRLNEASKVYYSGQNEIISNFEWDNLYDELTRLEDEMGIVLPDSPTQKKDVADHTYNTCSEVPIKETGMSAANSSDVIDAREISETRRARIPPYDQKEWGITLTEYNRLADGVEQGVPSFFIGKHLIYEFSMGYDSVDGFLERQMGKQKYNTEFHSEYKPLRNSVTQAEFQQICEQVLCNYSDVRRYHVNGAELWLEILSNRRKIPWTARLNFNDNDEITGKYIVVHSTYETARTPGNIGNNISNRIQSAKYRSI